MNIGQIFTQLISTIIQVGEPLDNETIQDTMQDARDYYELEQQEYEVDTYRGKSRWLNR